MRRPLGYVAPLLLALVAADGPAPPAHSQAVRRDLSLIETLVTHGLRLAAADEPLSRAACCQSVAERLADEINRAAGENDRERVAELTPHLRAVVESGVAANLDQARRHIPAGSLREKELEDLSARTAALLRPLQEQLRQTGEGEEPEGLVHILQTLGDGRHNAVKADPPR